MEHNELIIHSTPPDLFKNTTYPPAGDVKVTVVAHCTQIHNGKVCGARLFDIDVDLWESDVIRKKIKIKCHQCKQVEDFSLWK